MRRPSRAGASWSQQVGAVGPQAQRGNRQPTLLWCQLPHRRRVADQIQQKHTTVGCAQERWNARVNTSPWENTSQSTLNWRPCLVSNHALRLSCRSRHPSGPKQIYPALGCRGKRRGTKQHKVFFLGPSLKCPSQPPQAGGHRGPTRQADLVRLLPPQPIGGGHLPRRGAGQIPLQKEHRGADFAQLILQTLLPEPFQGLHEVPAVCLAGPRPAGKTSLARAAVKQLPSFLLALAF